MPYVSKIELRGFKSFGNTKVSIPLSKGLTAIVGPNGCGKSNVVDALCFVLGEMSAKTMRAERFSDLLFNGGNGQRPAPFAEVSLHFNNEDHTLPINSAAVVISRKVDRSGKCVYRIDKKRASRQEIVDLLANSMSSPGGYNFVMQGDVDRFIKMDPIDRRVIIDDLAGVAEYDEKKQKSLAELQRVETNLTSMGAVIGEISTQMEKLRSEREEAIRYKELKQELEQTKVALIRIQHDSLEKKLSQLQQKIKTNEEKLQELKNKHQRVVDGLAGHEEEIRRLDKRIEETQSASAFAEVEKIRERINLLNGMLNSTDMERAEIEREIAEISANLKKIGEGDQSNLSAEIASLSSKFGSLHKRFNMLKQTLETSESSAEARKVLHELRQVLNELHPIIDNFSKCIDLALRSSTSLPQKPSASELRDHLISLRAMGSQMERRLKHLKQQILEAQTELERAHTLEKETRSSIDAVRKEKDRFHEKISGLKREAASLEKKMNELNNELHAYKVEEASVRPQLENLERELKHMRAGAKGVGDVDQAKLERRASAIESELEALGPVNFRAIQDFKNAECRYNSEKLKYDKLVAERQTLLDFMHEIEEKKKEVFMKTFDGLSQYFSKIFSELSPGGTAKLVLENEEKPFDGGLEIEAKPEGKETTRIGALSGGERALTALAFIFALQRFRPTTLYVLDEIDAHLDDQNLRRVAEMIRRSSRESQIIVVTLHDSMMSVADRLFGVTIDKSGVSHLLMVELAGLAA